MTNSPATISAETVERLLETELQCARQLLTTIEQEYQLLGDRDIDKLPGLLSEKNQHISRLQTSSEQRERLLMQYSFDPGLPGLQACLSALDNPTNLTHLLKQLTETAEQCQKINIMNGRLVRQQQQQSLNALDILQGQNNLPTDTYTQQGISSKSAESRTLGKA